MDENKSTTPTDNQEEVTPPTPDPKGTDQQTPAPSEDNLDDTSKSTETPADGDKPKEGGEEDSPASKFDDDLDDWAEKTGRPKPESDRERELYQEIRDGQREYSRSKQAKDANNDVNKAIQEAKPADESQEEDEDLEDPGERAERMIQEERNLRLRSEYFNEKSVSTEESKIMGDILKEKVDRAKTPEAKKAAYDYWTNPDNLEDWHALAKARISASTDTTAIEQEAARKERERIAKEHQAGGSSRSAKVTTPAKPQGYNRTDYLKSDD